MLQDDGLLLVVTGLLPDYDFGGFLSTSSDPRLVKGRVYLSIRDPLFDYGHRGRRNLALATAL
jgi:hypothetical protein